MAKVIVYNNNLNRMENYYLGESEPMPYNTGGTLKVKEFRGVSKSSILWTMRSAMESWNAQRSSWGAPINVGYAFRRPWEGGHSNQSQHFAGTAFDVAQGWTNAQRAALRDNAMNLGVWSYIEPVSISPTWVHFDKRLAPPACAGGYPQLSRGSLGVYVLILQDGLNTLGFSTNGLDGIFGGGTQNAVTSYQRSRGINPDGVVGCSTWTALQREVVGKGRSATTVD